MVNNDEVELPEYSEENERSIVRKEDKVVLKYEGLLKVKCDILNNICTIKIDGYRHADAAGQFYQAYLRFYQLTRFFDLQVCWE